MSSKLLQGFSIGPWKVEPLRGEVSGPNGETHHLGPKVMDVFVCLAERANELVTRDQLLDVTWSGNTAFDEQLTRVVGDLRRALHDDPSDPTYIETVPKRGYRLIGEIHLPVGVKPQKVTADSESIAHPTKRKPILTTITVLVLVLVYVAFDTFVINPAVEEAVTKAGSQAESVEVTDERQKSIAVLPFVNMSDDPGNEYFADGLSEEILNLLSRIPDLKVIGRTSSFAFKGMNEDLRVIGQELGVATLLEGTVRKSGDRLRITAQLIDASNGAQIWSDTYNRTMTDIFAVQDDVAAAIIDALQLHVTAIPVRGRPTENVVAYALFLRARASFNGGAAYQDAENLLLEAVKLDPEFAEAYELLAFMYLVQSGGALGSAEGQELMGKVAAKALAIDPDLILAQALYQMGNIETYTHLGEIEALERVVREAPNNSLALDQLQFDLLLSGYLQEAVNVSERYVELEPLSWRAYARLFDTLYAAGHTREAMEALEIGDQLSPGNLDWEFGVSNLLAMRDDNAIAHFEARLGQTGAPSEWVRELVTSARDSETGQVYLNQRIPQIVAAMPAGSVRFPPRAMRDWYMFFGFLDRHFELFLENELTDKTWTDAQILVWRHTIFRRVGYTAHPKYLEVAERLGLMDVWEQRGPPDFCEKISSKWVCE